MNKRNFLICLIFFLVTVICVVCFVPVMAQAGQSLIVYYNFTDSTNNKAYACTQDTNTVDTTCANDVGTPPGWTDDWGGYEFSANGYSLVNTSNDQYAFGSPQGGQEEPYLRFNFTLNMTKHHSSTINWIYVAFEGNGSYGGPEGAYVYIANFSSEAWQDFATLTTSDATYTQNYTSGFSGLIDGNRLVLLAQAEQVDDGTEGVKADFVEVRISYINDIEAPLYSDNSTNTTGAKEPAEFRLKWEDDVALSHYIFSLDNCTGIFNNVTESSFPGIPTSESWSNETYVINDTPGCTMRWQVYANDTTNNWNASEIFTFTTTDKPPTYSNPDVNTTLAGTAANFTLDWNDVFGLSGYIFSTNNSGIWTNASFVSFSGTTNTSWNVTTLNNTIEALVQWRFYANDTTNNWNASEIFSFVTNEGEPPEYSKNSTNTTIAGDPCEFKLEWDDNVALNSAGQYIFSTNNSGTWLNSTTNTTLRRPNSVGTYKEWPIPSGGNHYSILNDENDLTYTETGEEDINWYRDTFVISDITIPSGASISSVKVYMRVKSVDSSWKAQFQTMLITNNTDYHGSSRLPTGWTNYTSTYTTNPNTSLPWTVDEVNNMEIGVYGRSTRYWHSRSETWVHRQGYASEVWAVVEYTYWAVIEYPYADMTNFTSTPQNATYGLTLNSTLGTVVAWCFYAKDNAGNWNGTNCEEGKQFTLTTTVGAPTFSNNQTSTRSIGAAANFTIDVIDNTPLDSNAGYIFSTDNSGTWTNASFVYFSGTGTTLTAWNVTTLNNIVGTLVQWKFYANDTSDNWGVSEIYDLTTVAKNIYLRGLALYYYTGERVNGNATVIPLENPESKTNTTVVNGVWSIDFDMNLGDVQYLSIIIDDNEKIGYNQLKLVNANPSTATLDCTTQNISISGYSVDTNLGSPISSGDVKVSVLDTDYLNTTSFSGTWNIDFHPCLVSGKIYTLQVLVSDNTGKRGEFLQKYPAK